jgi:hypothetical protein
LGHEKKREERKRRRAWQGERREPPSQGMMGGPNQPGQHAQDLQERLRPPISTSVCVSLGLKNPGDFTVAEGHRYPLVVVTTKVRKKKRGGIRKEGDIS